MKFTKRQVGYLFLGIIIWLPIGILVLVARFIFGYIEDTGKAFLQLFVPDRFIYTGLGVAFWLVIFYITGLIFRRTNIGTYFSNIPLLGTFFRTGGETMTLDRLTNLAPCLFLYSATCISYGWILAPEKVELQDDNADFELIDVYYPNVPTIVTGQVFAVRKENVMKLSNPSREIIDILLYGLRKPITLQYIPWEDETEERFKERAARFGLLMLATPASGER